MFLKVIKNPVNDVLKGFLVFNGVPEGNTLYVSFKFILI